MASLGTLWVSKGRRLLTDRSAIQALASDVRHMSEQMGRRLQLDRPLGESSNTQGWVTLGGRGRGTTEDMGVSDWRKPFFTNSCHHGRPSELSPPWYLFFRDPPHLLLPCHGGREQSEFTCLGFEASLSWVQHPPEPLCCTYAR